MRHLRSVVNLIGIATALFGASTLNASGLPSLEWSDDIRPGLSEAEVVDMLESQATSFSERGGGGTYTSMIRTSDRDYLFCQDQLYAMIDGEFATGQEFNQWFEGFLAAHREYGEPSEYEADEDWTRFTAKWETDRNVTFYFNLQASRGAQQAWSRQLYADDVGKPCM